MTSADQRDQLLALAERCERTGRPDRNLDADIYEALGFTVRRKPTTLLAPRTPPGGIYQQGSLWKAIGKISAEIDVAVSVIREKAPDWNWSLRQAPHRSATGTGRALKRFPFQRRSRFSGQIDSAGLYRGVAVSSPHGQLTQGNQTAVEGVVRPASLTLGLSPSPGHDAGWRGAIRGRSCSSRCWSLIMARFEPSRRTVMAGAGVLATRSRTRSARRHRASPCARSVREPEPWILSLQGRRHHRHGPERRLRQAPARGLRAQCRARRRQEGDGAGLSAERCALDQLHHAGAADRRQACPDRYRQRRFPAPRLPVPG
jgi:hypothetical protein